MSSSSAVDGRTVTEVERILNEGYVISSIRQDGVFTVILSHTDGSGSHQGRGGSFPAAFRAALDKIRDA